MSSCICVLCVFDDRITGGHFSTHTNAFPFLETWRTELNDNREPSQLYVFGPWKKWKTDTETNQPPAAVGDGVDEVAKYFKDGLEFKGAAIVLNQTVLNVCYSARFEPGRAPMLKWAAMPTTGGLPASGAFRPVGAGETR